MSVNIGEYAKVIGENRVFKVCGLTKGRKVIPDGWYLDGDNCAVNPKYCEKYNGAISVLSEA